MIAPDRDTVEALGLPTIRGLRVRRYRGPVDHDGMVAANNVWRLSIGVRELVTREGMDNLYAHLSGSIALEDCLVVEFDGEIAGYARVECQVGHDGGMVYEPGVILHPRLGGRGVERALLRNGERRLRQKAGGRAPGPTDRFRMWLWDSDLELKRVVIGEGYRPARHFFDMVRPDLEAIPALAMPEGLEVRPVLPQHWRPIWEADVEAFRDHWGEVDEGEEAYQRFLGEPDLVPELWQVAWDGDQVAGHVLVAVHAQDNARFGLRRGVLDSVAVRRPWRRRGLARGLIVRALRALREHGETSASLGVDAQNPHQALHLYESCGFVVDTSGTAYEKPFA